MPILFRPFRTGDLPDLLRIQRRNLLGNLDETERGQGFLSVEFPAAQLLEIHRAIPIVVADRGGTLGGYVFGTTLESSRAVPILAHMMGLFSGLSFDGKPLDQYRSFMYGPICVAGPLRGSGVLEGLFGELCRQLAGRFEIGVSFVSAANPRSLAAHVRKLGMEEIAGFEFDGKPFHMLAFSLDDVPDNGGPSGRSAIRSDGIA